MLSGRASLICGVVSDPSDRAELLKYQGATEVSSPEVVRWSKALKKCKRSWAEWRDAVPEMKPDKPKPPKANYSADETSRHCKKCGSGKSKVTNTRITGRLTVRYRQCLDCGQPRVSHDVCE